jgi:hypothetical protein
MHAMTPLSQHSRNNRGESKLAAASSMTHRESPPDYSQAGGNPLLDDVVRD